MVDCSPAMAVHAQPLQEYYPPTKLPWRPRPIHVICLSVGVMLVGSILVGLGSKSNDGDSSLVPSTPMPGQQEHDTHQPTPGPSAGPHHNIMQAPPTPQPSFSLAVPSPPVHLTARPVIVIGEATIEPTGGSGSVIEQEVTYRPGELTVEEQGLLLSQGLTAKEIAKTGKYVQYANGDESHIKFHGRPDFGATFPVPDNDEENPGGWVYVINSEMSKRGEGGVGAIAFDKNGNIITYDMILTGTTMNCGGGKTPWNTWVSCEERDDGGDIYQVDPFGKRNAQITSVGAGKGRFESFAYDVRNKTHPRFFATEDKPRGALRRYSPSDPEWDNDPWQLLHGNGTLDFLVLNPDNNTFEWVPELETAKANAKENYPESEGIDVEKGILYFVSKRMRALFVLDLDRFTYAQESTDQGLFDGKPDQIKRILEDGTDHHEMLYFTEENGDTAGIHGRDPQGRFFTILEGVGRRYETTGLSFSPDGRHLYFCFQNVGSVYDVTRLDGLPFHGKTLNAKYHDGPLS